jgi:hypothetical protein
MVLSPLLNISANLCHVFGITFAVFLKQKGFLVSYLKMKSENHADKRQQEKRITVDKKCAQKIQIHRQEYRVSGQRENTGGD